MRTLRGLHVEDCYLTFRLVQRVFSSHAHTQVAETREQFLDLASRTQNDFIILDGSLPGWSIEQYAEDLAQVHSIPLFIFSGTPVRDLGPLLNLSPKAVLRKEDGPHVILEAVLSYFYALEEFNSERILPKPLSLS